MSDIVTLARTARESLARGLNALQGSSNSDPALLELAAPIARAMGGLHQIERSGGSVLMPHARDALANIQSALQQLQSYSQRDDSVLAAMEAVAGALGGAHTLARAVEPQAAAPAYAAPPAPPYAPAPPAPVYAPPSPAPAHAAAPPAPAYAAAPPAPAYAAAPPAPAYAPAPPAHAYTPAPPAAAHASRMTPSPPVTAPGRALDGVVVNAELGAHSPSNFFKGLAGNDIVDHGGLFVATYNLPTIGSQVRLRVSLPGGYEFEANAVVRWRREANDVGGTDAPPGFGAQFTDITAEARQLVYRYVRNREPLFHDDL